jgi:hypothetical protein
MNIGIGVGLKYRRHELTLQSSRSFTGASFQLRSMSRATRAPAVCCDCGLAAAIEAMDWC